MRWGAALAVCAAVAAAPASGQQLAGKYDALAAAASACTAATITTGVDRKVLAAAGWGATGSAEIDHLPVSWARKKGNPFALRINAYKIMSPEHCWFTANMKRDVEFDRAKVRIERLMGRAPDSVESNDMRTTRWVNAQNTLELWMMPAHELCDECPTLFVTVKPRRAEQSPAGPLDPSRTREP